MLDSASALGHNAWYLARAYARPLVRWHVPVAMVTGRAAGTGQKRTILVAGWKRTIAYYVQRYFDHCDKPIDFANVPLLALPALLKRVRTDADMIIARVPGPGSRWLFDDSFLHVPEAVEARLEIPRDLSTLEQASTRARRNIARIHEHDLTWELSTDPRDFDPFYDRYYVPFLRQRYGDLAHEIERPILNRAFRRGCILWVLHDQVRVAGALLQGKGSVLRWRVMGAITDEIDVVRIGALSAIYLFSAEYARQHGFRWLDLGFSKSSPRDGVLSHKRSWGARVYCPWKVDHDLLFAWDRWDDDMAHFLSTTPLIFRHKGGLSAVAALSANERSRSPYKAGLKVAMPGLSDVFVLGVDLGAHPSTPATTEATVHVLPPTPSGVFLRSQT